ncbi:Uu.00g069110.m01.CDS01 [Anthostomella pinea]|uniref:Uu.00g069110.m01.CDS01 n=1 Tax=Anthostomella pinea TaxID=933095 RepID=A0AAI8YNN2_9PEZI|nr:Uu.00g069110.m01.CDS01 [Anthostomella pinea]
MDVPAVSVPSEAGMHVPTFSFSSKPAVPEDTALSQKFVARQPNINETQRNVSVEDDASASAFDFASPRFSFTSSPATEAQPPDPGFIHYFGQSASGPQETKSPDIFKHTHSAGNPVTPVNRAVKPSTALFQSSPRSQATATERPPSNYSDHSNPSPVSRSKPAEVPRFNLSTTMPIRQPLANITSPAKPMSSKNIMSNPTVAAAKKAAFPPVRDEKVRAGTKDGVRPSTRTVKQHARIPSTSEETEEDSSDESSAESFDSGDDQDPYSDQPESTRSSREESEAEEVLNFHTQLLRRPPGADDLDEITSSPLFTPPVWQHAKTLGNAKATFPQYALLGGNSDGSASTNSEEPLFYNVAAPSSVFICGSQGSGKSHTLSCFLENCLVPSKRLGRLPRPLTGVVFHYDTFISDLSGTPCEAAYLASNRNVKVRVLCAPTNIRTMRQTYSRLPGVNVEELRLKESDLNTKRMLDLMAVGAGGMPLYMHVIQRLLRDMRIDQQNTGHHFNYTKFKLLLQNENLTPMQSVPLHQRLETLESFMVKPQASRGSQVPSRGTDWTPVAGQLTIVDLSCPCVTSEMACSLFNICLSLFLEQKQPGLGRVVALDEAHKYMTESAEAQTLTNSLLSSIRLQRHEALRVIIATQEPTISPKLLDLCSITVVHRFQSPDWMRVLKGHLAGLSTASEILIKTQQRKQKNGDIDADTTSMFEGFKGISIAQDNPMLEMMSHIVQLKTGEALIFAPSAIVGLERKGGREGTKDVVVPKRLDHAVMRVRIRARLTADGGRSIMAA